MSDYVKNEIYAQHLARGEKGFYANFAKDVQSVYTRFYVRRLSELSMNRFKWDNLPATIDPRFLEMTLLHNALALFFESDFMATPESDRGAFMALAGSPSGQFNPTNNPTSFTVTAQNFPTTILRAKDCVPIWANVSRISDMDLVQIYAHRLATLDRTLDINAANARRTKVAIADENSRHSITNIVRQIEQGDPAVYVNTPIAGAISVFDFGVQPKTIEELHIYKVRLWNECMMLLGIQSANQDKKERLVASEVDANSEQIDLNEHNALFTRQLAARQINDKYGLNVSVDFVTQQNEYKPIEGN